MIKICVTYFTQGILIIYAFGLKLSKDIIVGSFFSVLSSVLLTFVVHSVEI